MSKKVIRTIKAWCSDSGAELKVSFDASEVTAQMKTRLEKRLGKKGLALEWGEEGGNAELFIRVVWIDQGNRLLRYMFPFLSPAVLEIEGEVALDGSTPQQFHYVQREQIGLFGGSARDMLKLCAQRVAKKIARDVRRNLKSQTTKVEMDEGTVLNRSQRQWEASAKACISRGESGSDVEAAFVELGLEPEFAKSILDESCRSLRYSATKLLIGSSAFAGVALFLALTSYFAAESISYGRLFWIWICPIIVGGIEAVVAVRRLLGARR